MKISNDGVTSGMVCSGPRELPGHRSVRAKVRKVPANQGEFHPREEKPVTPERDRGASLNHDAGQCLLSILGEAWKNFLP